MAEILRMIISLSPFLISYMLLLFGELYSASNNSEEKCRAFKILLRCTQQVKKYINRILMVMPES
jgi:hypothetical protein